MTSLFRKTASTGFALGVFVFASSQTLYAQQSGLGIGGQVGSTGIGVTADAQLNSFLSARGNLDLLRFETQSTVTVANDPNTNFSAKTNMPSAGLSLNLHPFGNGFRLGAGATFANPKIEGVTDYNSNAVTNNDGKINFSIEAERRLLPYAGIGYTGQNKGGWFFQSDLGLLSTGAYSSSVTADLSCGSDIVCQTEQSLVEDEARAEMQRIAADLPEYYPVVRLGFGYRF